MLSFQVTKAGNAIQISCDPAGMARLLETFAWLLRERDHVHLRGPSAGGNDLSEMTERGEKAVREVIIDYYPTE